MVWHAYQLNPRDFLQDCLRHGKMQFWRTPLPWPVINAFIDDDTFEFSPPEGAIKHFQRSTGCSWSNLNDAFGAQVECPTCKQTHHVPWTKWDSELAWKEYGPEGKKSLQGESMATGLADKNFLFHSPCGTLIDHALLRTQKFRKDVEALCSHDVPMPGTLLTINGKQNQPD